VDATDDLSVEDLTFTQRFLADRIIKITGAKSGGGCKAFYSPDAWEARGEKYGLNSLLIVVHDGGDLAPWFNLDYQCYDLYEKLQAELAEVNMYAESCTCWYSAIYPTYKELESDKS